MSYLAFPNHSLDNGLPSPFLLSFYSWVRCSYQDSCKVAHFYPRLTGSPFPEPHSTTINSCIQNPRCLVCSLTPTVINCLGHAIIKSWFYKLSRSALDKTFAIERILWAKGLFQYSQQDSNLHHPIICWHPPGYKPGALPIKLWE